MSNENLSVHIAVQFEGLDNYLFEADGVFSKKDIEKTELADYKIVEFRTWHGYFTVVIKR